MSRKKAENYTTIKIRTKSLKQLRMLYGLRNKKMIDILDELIAGELERVKLAEAVEEGGLNETADSK